MSKQREPLHQPLTDAELARLVRDTVGPHAGVPTRTLLREWEVSRVELVEVGLTRLVVKHLPPGSLEARIITALRADGLRCVPPFLGLLPRPEVPDEIMVLEHIDGPALAEGSSQDAYRHAVGQLVLMQAAYWDRPERLRALGLPLHTPEHLEARARLAFDLTRERIGDGTYTHVEVSHLAAAAPALDAYLSALDFLAAQPLTLVHGDFHYGNIIIPADTKRPPAPPVFLDWSSACGAIGLLDLVALLDVSERMMAPPPDPPKRRHYPGTDPDRASHHPAHRA